MPPKNCDKHLDESVAMESVAAMVRILCSDAGRDITGSVLPIDGGWTAA